MNLFPILRLLHITVQLFSRISEDAFLEISEFTWNKFDVYKYIEYELLFFSNSFWLFYKTEKLFFWLTLWNLFASSLLYEGIISATNKDCYGQTTLHSHHLILHNNNTCFISLTNTMKWKFLKKQSGHTSDIIVKK